jgi:fructose-1,6-bisphosphatase/inositol monophosphatase family enzyme
MTPDDILDLFESTSRAIADTVERIPAADLRNKTGRPGQYALDILADQAALSVLHNAPVRVVSEESGESGKDDAEITIVIDPVDGSTNCSRGISYWATSLCALDGDGALAAFVVNHASRDYMTAVRGGGAYRNGKRMSPSTETRVDESVVALAGLPARILQWKQFRVLGCAALALCDVAAGGIDGYVDGASFHAPWDYLGGYLMCVEAGAKIVDFAGQPLVTSAQQARRQLIAAGTPELLDALTPAAGKLPGKKR